MLKQSFSLSKIEQSWVEQDVDPDDSEEDSENDDETRLEIEWFIDLNPTEFEMLSISQTKSDKVLVNHFLLITSLPQTIEIDPPEC